MGKATRTLLASLVALAFLGLVASTEGAGATPKTLYRITGCVSRGDSAYTHGPARREVAIGFDDGPAADTAAFVTMLEHSHA